MRLGRLICGDIHFQWKYGFYFIYFILTFICVWDSRFAGTLENGYCFYYDIL